MIKAFEGKTPEIHDSCFVADNATVIGDVTLGRDASVWYGAVIRGDAETIVIGPGSNIQDCAVLHADKGFRLTLGEGVTVGHSALVHGAEVDDHVIIGMHATLLNGCVMEEDFSIHPDDSAQALGQSVAELASGCSARSRRLMHTLCQAVASSEKLPGSD